MSQRTHARFAIPLALAAVLAPAAAHGQTPSAAERWRQHDLTRPRPAVVAPVSQQLPAPVPADAVVLFDGRDLSGWTGRGGAAPWTVENGYFQVAPGSGGIQSREEFGDVQLHVEWASPNPPRGTGQDRGNSGIMLMGGRYEIQVLDSYQAETYADGQAGAIYGQYPPLFNATRAPGEWQAYDIFFRRPRFRPDGTIQEPARVTVVLNGIVVQNNEEFRGPTTWLQTPPWTAHPEQGPIHLQDHGHPVRFRNVWARRLPSRPTPPANYAIRPGSVPAARLAQLAGTYYRGQGTSGPITVTRQGDHFLVDFHNGLTPQRAHAVSPTEIALTETAGQLVFEGPAQGTPTGLIFRMGGADMRARRGQ